MTSKLVVNTIEADTGISSVSFASSISMSSTSVFHFSDAGVNIGADTNISRAGNGILAFNINSSEKVRIDSNGRLSIGGENAGHFYSGADNLVVADFSADAGISIFGGGSNKSYIAMGSTTFGTGALEAFIEKTHGNNNPLTIATQVGNSNIELKSANDFIFSSYSGPTERLRITSGGKFGFGTSSPDQMVHIHKGSAGSIDSTATSVLTLENSTTAVLQFLTPNTASAQLRFGDPQDNGAGFIDYSHTSNTMAFGANGPTRMQLDGNGHLGIDVASVTQLANSLMLTLRPTDGDGIRFIRPGDSNNSPSVHMDLTTSTSGSTYRNGGDAYLLRLNSYNNDLEFRSYLDGGTGGIIRLRTHDGSSGSIRYWQMDEKGVTTHRSRSTVVKTHEFTYTGGAGGGTLNVDLLSISGYSASSTAVVEIKYVGMYGLAGSYISQGIWLCSYRRANGGSAANALAQQTHNGGSNSASNVTMAWVGDNLRLTVGAFTGFTVHVTATVYNATINVLV